MGPGGVDARCGHDVERGAGGDGGEDGGDGLDGLGHVAGIGAADADEGAAAVAVGLDPPGVEALDFGAEAATEGVGVDGAEGDGAGGIVEVPGVGEGLLGGFDGVVGDGGLGGGGEEVEDGAEDGALEIGVVGDAEGAAEVEGDPEGAGRLDDFGVLADQGDAGGGDAFTLDEVAERADGARTGRSNGAEDDGVDTLTLHETADFAAGVFELLGEGEAAHDGVVPLGDAADFAGGGEFPQAVQGEDDVEVGLEAGAVPVGADVGEDEVGGVDVAGDEAVVECAGDEGGVLAAVQAGGGEEGDFGVGQGCGGDPGSRVDVDGAGASHVGGFLGVEVGEADHGGSLVGW